MIKTTRKLICTLTDDEANERASKASELDQEKRRIDADRKSTASVFREQLKHLDKQIAELTEQATTKQELREVECEERESLVNGCEVVEVWRTDTNELIETLDNDPLEVDERQPGLPFAAPDMPVLRCTAIEETGNCFDITAEQADAAERELAGGAAYAQITINDPQGAGVGIIAAVKILRGRACDTCGIVGTHRPECADMKAEAEDYDRNDTAAVAAKIAEVPPPSDKPLASAADATVKVKPKRKGKAVADASGAVE